MYVLSNDELSKINGGGAALALAITAAAVFIIGVIDGYVRPLKCR